MRPACLTLTALFTLMTVACVPVAAALPPPQPPAWTPQPVVLPPAAGSTLPADFKPCDCTVQFEATPAAGLAQPPLILCGCPFLPPLPTEIGSNPVPLPGSTVTMADNGQTFTMYPGEHFLLELGTDALQWTVRIDRPDVLSRIPSMLVIRGTQGIYEAHHPGQAHLTAVGDPLCRNADPMCMAPSVIFQVTFIVQSTGFGAQPVSHAASSY